MKYRYLPSPRRCDHFERSRKYLKTYRGCSDWLAVDVDRQAFSRQNLHLFHRKHFHFRVVITMTAADRPEVTQQFQLAEVSIHPDRKESIVQNGARTDVEITSIV